MKIIKYKKKANGKYSVFLDDGREFVYYEDVILKYNLLLKKEIDEESLIEIHNTNLEYDVYYVALKSINARYKSVFELKQSLIKKEYPLPMIDKAIEKLIQQKYLDDRSFTKSYIYTQMNTTMHGPNRIRRDLVQKKVDSAIIDDEMSIYTEEIQQEKIDKLVQSAIKKNHTRGGVVLKQKVVNDLKLQGFDSSVISSVILNAHFPVDSSIAKKEYDKLYNKYSKKYEGYELKHIIHEKMYQKGLLYEEDE